MHRLTDILRTKKHVKVQDDDEASLEDAFAIKEIKVRSPHRLKRFRLRKKKTDGATSFGESLPDIEFTESSYQSEFHTSLTSFGRNHYEITKSKTHPPVSKSPKIPKMTKSSSARFPTGSYFQSSSSKQLAFTRDPTSLRQLRSSSMSHGPSTRLSLNCVNYGSSRNLGRRQGMHKQKSMDDFLKEFDGIMEECASAEFNNRKGGADVKSLVDDYSSIMDELDSHHKRTGIRFDTGWE